MDNYAAMAAGLDLWPHTLQQTLTGKNGSQHEQVLSATSVRGGIAAELIDADDFKEQDHEQLVMLVVQEPQLDGDAGVVMVCQLHDREKLLMWAVGLTQRLVADIGPERARELLKGSAEIAESPPVPTAPHKA